MWRVTPLDIETMRASYRILAAELARTGTGKLDHDEARTEQDVLKAGAYGGHQIGATRMSAGPKDSVADPDLTKHGVENLPVARACVLPTSGQANPTLTLPPLTLRLADRSRAA